MRANVLRLIEVAQMKEAYLPSLTQLQGLVTAYELVTVMANAFEAFADDEDIQAWIAFYESDAGQRFIKKQPLLASKIGADMDLLIKERLHLMQGNGDA